MKERSKELSFVSFSPRSLFCRAASAAFVIALGVFCLARAAVPFAGDLPPGAVFNPELRNFGETDIDVDANEFAELDKHAGEARIACRIPIRGGSSYHCTLVSWTSKPLAGLLLTERATGDLNFAPMRVDGISVT